MVNAVRKKRVTRAALGKQAGIAKQVNREFLGFLDQVGVHIQSAFRLAQKRNRVGFEAMDPSDLQSYSWLRDKYFNGCPNPYLDHNYLNPRHRIAFKLKYRTLKHLLNL